MSEKAMAKLTEVKAYFEISSMKQFRDEWTEVSDADKQEIRELVYIEVN